jgi:hypothetical protein
LNIVAELEHASCAMRAAAQIGLIAGDQDFAERCGAVASRIEAETSYARGVERLGLDRVPRRAGPRAFLGVLLADPAIRALRESRGLSNPPLRGVDRSSVAA